MRDGHLPSPPIVVGTEQHRRPKYVYTDLYLADEVFMCGTAAEITPVRSVDDQEIGVGDVTREIQQVYLDTVRGATDRFAEWRELVPSVARA